MGPVMGNCDNGLVASGIAPSNGSGKQSALEVKLQRECSSNENCLETMFPEMTKRTKNMPANDYGGMALAGLLRTVKRAEFRDRQTQRVLAGITNLMQGQSYSGRAGCYEDTGEHRL